MSVSLSQAFEKIQEALRNSSESEQILQEAFRRFNGRALSRLELFSAAGSPLSHEALEWARQIASQRILGKPLQHLLGFQTFWDHEYEVGPEVLVPRPETEILVSTVMNALERLPDVGLGCEIGLGSGAISIELLAKFADLKMIATELTAGAIKIAGKNAVKILGADALEKRLKIVQARDALDVSTSLKEALAGRRADFLVSNPPYLTQGDQIERQVREYEPPQALFAPEGKPLYFYEQILDCATVVLKAGASVFLELAAERAQEISQLFVERGWQVMVYRDLNGYERVLEAKLWTK